MYVIITAKNQIWFILGYKLKFAVNNNNNNCNKILIETESESLFTITNITLNRIIFMGVFYRIN